MKYWRINTDRDARSDVETCDLWYLHGMVFTGDFLKYKLRHAAVLRKLNPGDKVFMHHSRKGIVGCGIATEKWDGKIYEADNRLLYRKEEFEYRIRVDWLPEYDRRCSPLSIKDRLPYMGTYSEVNPQKWNINLVLKELQK